MNNQIKISGYVLAGGKSSRMGTDKALIMVQNDPLLKRMIRVIEPYCTKVAISGLKDDYLDFNIEMVPDLYTDCGPISGIVSSLNHSETDWCLLLSVDSLFVNDELIQFLLSQIGQYDCIIPQHKDGVEPLIGLYNRKILPEIKEMISQNDFKIMNLLSRVNTKYVDCSQLVKQFPRLFFNMNQPEDYFSV